MQTFQDVLTVTAATTGLFAAFDHVGFDAAKIDARNAFGFLLVFDRNNAFQGVLDERDRIGRIAILHAFDVSTRCAAGIHPTKALLAELDDAHRAVGDGHARKDQVRDELGIAVAASMRRQDRIDHGGGAGIQRGHVSAP